MSAAPLEVKDSQVAGALHPEAKAALESFQRTIETFKSEHSEALKKKADRDDPLVKEREEKQLKTIEDLKKTVNDAVEAMNKKAAELERAGKGGKGEREEKNAKINALRCKELDAFDHWFRTGEEDEIRVAQAEGKKLETELEAKDLSTIIAADGGYMVDPEREAEMIEVLNETSPMRTIARQMDIGTKEIEVPVNKKGATAAWVGELETRVRTLTSTIEMVKFGASEIYGLPLATLSILEDGEFDVEDFLYEETIEAMEIAENTAFVAGDGVKKPRGFTTVDTIAHASWTWGKLGYEVTGAAGAFAPSYPGTSVGSTPAANGADALINLCYAFKPSYRSNLDWAMRRATLREVRKLKDGDGAYLFKDALTESGLLTMVLGYPVQEFEDMPAIGADALAIALGDFYRGYLIVNRIGLQVRRDEITSPGNVIFHFRRRTGGDVRDYQAIKFLKFGTS
jgi:HK97 family phage major capsid protein